MNMALLGTNIMRNKLILSDFLKFPLAMCYRNYNRDEKLRLHAGKDRYHYRKKFSSERYKEQVHPSSNRNPNSFPMVYGFHPISLAIEANIRECYRLYFKEGSHTRPNIRKLLDLCETKNIPIQSVKLSKLDQMCDENNLHQGLCLEASPLPILNYDNERLPDLSLEKWLSIEAPGIHKVLNKTNSLWVYLDHIHDPQNLGAIIRTCYYLGVDSIIKGVAHCCPITNAVSKASSGITEIFPVISATNCLSLLREFQENQFEVITGMPLSVEDTISLAEYTPKKKTLLVVGNEGDGVDPALVKQADTLVSIPFAEGRANAGSLNVSVATSIIVHHILSKQSQARIPE